MRKGGARGQCCEWAGSEHMDVSWQRCASSASVTVARLLVVTD